jgi:MFS family permease
MPFTLVLRIFFPFALGYFLASIFRSINAVIAPDLVRDLGLGASELGFASSAFFLSATLLQLPYGILLDRFDPRRTYACCLLLCALGGVISALAGGMLSLTFGRGLIAVGAAASAVTSYKIYSMWYPPERLPLANGLCMAAGGLGLMTGTAPVEAALQWLDWRDIHMAVAGMLLASALLVLVIPPAKATRAAGITLWQQIRGLGQVLTSLAFWRVAPLTMAVVGVYAGTSTLWAGPWVRDVAGISGAAAAYILLFLTGALTLAGLLTGWLTGLAGRLGLSPTGFAAASAVLFVPVLVVLHQQWVQSIWAVLITWALFGFLASLNFVTYAALGQQFSKEMTGRLNACLTLSWMLGAFVLQNLYGLVLDRFPSADGSYAVEGHRLGMGMMLLVVVVALVWFLAASLVLRRRAGKVEISN